MVGFNALSPRMRPARRATAGRTRTTLRVIVLGCLIAAIAAPQVHAAYPGSNGRIAYQIENDDGTSNLWWANPDLSGPEQLTFSGSDGDPAWSADGQMLAFATQRFATAPPGPEPGFRVDVMTLNVATGQENRLTTPAALNEQPSFSPDGRRIVMAMSDPWQGIESGIYTMRATDGGDLRKVIGTPQHAAYVLYPRFSPDGSRISFAAIQFFDWDHRGAAQGNGAIYVVNADGTGLRRLTPWGFLLDYVAEWSPDGTQLVMQTNWRQGNRPSLSIINADGTDLRHLTDEAPLAPRQPFQASFSPTWSPDGSLIMFNCAPGELSFWDFCTIRPDGTGRTLVRSTSEFEHRPAWQPAP
jgi:TolB protein